MERKVIRISAADSPNVREGLRQQAVGLVPDNRIMVPGIVTFAEYQYRLAQWDEQRICESLNAEFWEPEA